MKFDRGLIIALSFVLLSLGSATYVSLAALNYLRLYPALDEMQNQMPYQVDKLSFVAGANYNESTLTAQISVSNPSDYSGFRLRTVSLSLFLYDQANRSITLFSTPNVLDASQTVQGQLGPHAVDSITLAVPLTSDQARQIVSFDNSYSGNVMGEVNLRIDIVTFLVPVTGSVAFTRIQDVALSSN